jgi:hypothetical protein
LRSVPAYMAPGESDLPQPKSGTPPWRLRSSTFHSFETPQEPKMLRAQNAQGEGGSARYNRFPPPRHVRTLFLFEIEFRFTFLDQKSQKVLFKRLLSFCKNSIILNGTLAGASEHKSEKFFLCVFKSLKIFEILII